MFTTPKKAATSFHPHPYLSPRRIFRVNVTPTVSTDSSPAGQAQPSATPFEYSPLLSQTPTPRKRYWTPGDAPFTPSPRVLRTGQRKGHHRVGVRQQVQSHNSPHTERAFSSPEKGQYQPVSPMGPSIGHVYNSRERERASPPDSTEFPDVARDVRRTFAKTRLPMSTQDRVFNEHFEKLGLGYVVANGLVDPCRAEEIQPTTLDSEQRRLFQDLEQQRMVRERTECQKAKLKSRLEAEAKALKVEQENMAQAEAEQNVRYGRARKHAEAEARKAADRAARNAIRMHDLRISQANRERERLENLNREARQMEDNARLSQERNQAEFQNQRREEERAQSASNQRRTQKEARARAEHLEQENARLRMQDHIEENLSTPARDKAETRFMEQEQRFRAETEEYARQYEQVQQDAPQTQWNEYFYCAQQQQYNAYYQQQEQHCQEPYPDTDIPMRDPSSYFDMDVSIADVSMASIPATDPPPPIPSRSPSPDPYIPPPVPRTEAEWFALYDAKWKSIRQSDASDTRLTFAHFPWPVFQFVERLEDLNEDTIKDFFRKKYTGRLDKTWKDDLRRWHTDKFAQISGKIWPQALGEVEEGFLQCIKIMTVFQSEKEAEATRRH